mgnify:CR=1 FL=1
MYKGTHIFLGPDGHRNFNNLSPEDTLDRSRESNPCVRAVKADMLHPVQVSLAKHRREGHAMRCQVLIAIAAVVLAVCQTSSPSNMMTTSGNTSAFFESPEQSVPRIAEMLRQSAWEKLARYYDLSGSRIDRSELTSGRYFLNAPADAREMPPPENELARYRHPFHPSYRFRGLRSTDDPNVVIVELILEVDQGAGAPPRRSIDEFPMVHHPEGWQVLPAESKRTRRPARPATTTTHHPL